MKLRLSVSLAMALGALASQPAFGQLTLDLNGFGKQNLTSSGNGIDWTMEAYKPKVIPNAGDIDEDSDPNLVAAFDLWNKTNGNFYKLKFVPKTAAILTVDKYTPSLSDSGLAGLVLRMSLSYPKGTKTGRGTPNPPVSTGIPGPMDATWLDVVTTNVWLVNKENTVASAKGSPPNSQSYLELLRGVKNPTPTYPVSVTASRFLDDPERQGEVGKTIYFWGDAILATVTLPTNGPNGVVNVYGDVRYGFEVKGVKGDQQGSLFPPPPQDSDLGMFGNGIPQTVPEPAQTAVLGMGVIAAGLIRRKKNA